MQRCESAHAQAISYAQLARDTVAEQSAIKAVSTAKNNLQTATKEVGRLEHEATEAERLSCAREQELTAQLDQFQAEQEKLEGDLHTLQAARAQANAELGAEKHATIVAGFKDRQARVDELRRQVIEAQMELHDFHVQGVQDLTDWPELQKDVAGLVVFDTPTTKVLQATLLYIDVLLENARNMNLNFPRPSVRGGFSLWDFLLIPISELQWDHRALTEGFFCHAPDIAGCIGEVRSSGV